MALENRLEVKMLQKLILTPQLQQAIKLLQMPQLELSQTLNNELVENPFLEEVGEDSPEDSPVERHEAEPGPDAPQSSELAEGESFRASEEAEAPLERLLGFGVDEYFDNRSYDGRDLGYFTPDFAQTQSLDQYAGGEAETYDNLTWQLRFTDASGPVLEAAEAIIGNIDDRGYLEATIEEISQYTNVDEAHVLEALKLVQSFDPPGIAARDLQECLLLQLKPLELEGTLVESIIRNNLGDIERRRYTDMAAEYKLHVDEILHAVRVIEGLDPKPGSSLSAGETVYIKPDVYVVRDGEGFRIVLNDENIPNIRINGYYRRILAQRSSLNKDEKEYLAERMRSAVWLLKSLDHRNKTLYRVTESILKFQREFFDRNVAYLRPLNLKDVAEDLQLHESTISRATSNKYLSCEHGLFGFRFFFSSGLKSGDGEVSSTYVKDVISKVIEQEDQKKPFSDQKISNMLRDQGIKVARRTVAKYREEMNIPPQSQRKRLD